MGMSQKQYENEIRELAFKFLGAPTVILIGMFAVGAIIDSFVGTNNIFKYIFLGIGGVPSVIAYYATQWRKFKRKQ